MGTYFLRTRNGSRTTLICPDPEYKTKRLFELILTCHTISDNVPNISRDKILTFGACFRVGSEIDQTAGTHYP